MLLTFRAKKCTAFSLRRLSQLVRLTARLEIAPLIRHMPQMTPSGPSPVYCCLTSLLALERTDVNASTSRGTTHRYQTWPVEGCVPQPSLSPLCACSDRSICSARVSPGVRGCQKCLGRFLEDHMEQSVLAHRFPGARLLLKANTWNVT